MLDALLRRFTFLKTSIILRFGEHSSRPARLFSPRPNPLQWTEISTTRKPMPLSGEAIRLMNYIDDVVRNPAPGPGAGSHAA